MRKGTKQIRLITTRGNDYYVYDLDEDVFGKRKRLYAKTRDELDAMIDEATAKSEENVRKELESLSGTSIKDFANFYFLRIVGSVPPGKLKQYIIAFKNVVYKSNINRDMSEITYDMLYEFYVDIVKKYSLINVDQIDEVLRKLFYLANISGINDLDFSTFPHFRDIFEDLGGAKNIRWDYIAEKDEIDALTEYVMNNPFKKVYDIAAAFALTTGLLLEDIVKIRFSDFDPSIPAVKIDDRQVILDQSTVIFIQQMIDERCLDPKDEFLFPTSTEKINVVLSAATKKCVLPKGIASKKAIHKAYIVHQIEKGVSIESLQKRFGYKKATDVLKIYEEYQVMKMLSE